LTQPLVVLLYDTVIKGLSLSSLSLSATQFQVFKTLSMPRTFQEVNYRGIKSNWRFKVAPDCFPVQCCYAPMFLFYLVIGAL